MIRSKLLGIPNSLAIQLMSSPGCTNGVSETPRENFLRSSEVDPEGIASVGGLEWSSGTEGIGGDADSAVVVEGVWRWKGRAVGGNTVVGMDGGCGGEMRDA